MNDYHKATLDKKKSGCKIRNAIINSKYTIDEISINLELQTARVVYEWMNGNKFPNIENLLNLSLMLNVKMEDLIAWR